MCSFIRCFSVSFVILGMIPSMCFGYSSKYNRLINEKQRKMQELEQCSGNVNGWKMAGISTLGLTAAGVAGNIALANKSKEYDKKIESTEKSISNFDQKISDRKQKIIEEETKCKNSGGQFVSGKCKCEDKDLKDGACVDKAQTDDVSSDKAESEEVNKENTFGYKVTWTEKDEKLDMGMSGYAECNADGKCDCSVEMVTENIGNIEETPSHNFSDSKECKSDCVNFCKNHAKQKIAQTSVSFDGVWEIGSNAGSSSVSVTGLAHCENYTCTCSVTNTTDFNLDNQKIIFFDFDTCKNKCVDFCKDAAMELKPEIKNNLSSDIKTDKNNTETIKTNNNTNVLWQQNVNKTLNNVKIDFKPNWSFR